ncbi:PHD finger protein At1g33420-like [Zingiber officinale]|uniref:PHD finger protein At1g33420-like n=1 Tax=Zingiber officinale TaxID=94328 RepID=UPI001C4D8DC1|nr:PHD finger protein At1g33420-like [Zingiber officinale]
MVRVDAMAVDGRPLKRARQRAAEDGLQALPVGGSGGGEHASADGPFRLSVRSFIARHARVAPPLVVPWIRTWRIPFQLVATDASGTVVDLDVVEEDVSRSKRVYCDYCRIIGWSENPVCCTRYHFIIRNESSPTSFHQQRHCSHCRALRDLSALRCGSCDHEMAALDLEELAHTQLDDSTHLLHGVIHANGYGHLLRINGRESGSKTLMGCDLMEFWDRLCKVLHVRKVSVMDVSKKYGMEYRLIHGVATGRSWYGNWGYEFGAGSFAHTAETYQSALKTLSAKPLSPLHSSRGQELGTQLEKTVALYTFLSPRRLETLHDLFSFIFKLLEDTHGHGEKNQTELLPQCRWRETDIARAEDAVVKILCAVNKLQWVTQRALQRATFRSVGSIELLDYCLKRLGNRRVADGSIITVRCNSKTNSVEYRLEPAAASDVASPAQCRCRPSRENLIRDLRLLYDTLLNPAKMQLESPRRLAATILDCKQFVKHYDRAKDVANPNPLALHVWCHVELVDRPKDYVRPPPELLILPLHATVADLKYEATKAFKEAYLILQSFRAVQVVVDGEVAHDDMLVNFLLGSDDLIRVEGRLGDGCVFEQFRMERGTETWTVDCACGSKDDDGERMLTCDSCGVWKHTRCSGISDFDEVPAKFICGSCSQKPKYRVRGKKTDKYVAPGMTCQYNVASSNSGKGKGKYVTLIT